MIIIVKRNIVKINADQSNCLHTGVDGLERSEGAGLSDNDLNLVLIV